MKKNGIQRAAGIVVVLILMFLVVSFRPVMASDFGNFHGALAQAYPHYREALFYLRTGNAAVAEVELEQWSSKWEGISEQFLNVPPDVYSDDPAWAATLTQIGTVSRDGLSLARSEKLPLALKTLEPIRKSLSNLRQTSHVIIFSDYVDQANQMFENLFQFRHNPPAFDNEDQLNAFRRAVSFTTYAYQQVVDRAPGVYGDDPEFQRLMKQSLYSLGRLWVAIAEKNQLNLINILREMRSSDRMLFLRFG